MSQSSGLTKPPRRVPQQERGERRVAALLDAAAAVIAEVGYEAATMTAVAERAGASIGAVYQYFPNKDAIVRALRMQYGDEMDARWRRLVDDMDVDGGDTTQLVDRMFDLLVDFIESRPAYLPLLSAPISIKRDPAARHRLRKHFATLFRRTQPALTPADALRVAHVAVQVIKAMGPVLIDAKPKERQAVVREFKLVLVAYLTERLRPPASP
ncbi:MAG TPA: TetR/AcrR family transcriptional regulator [Gemmatimonadaceae bacterium]|jgi:AcrR family transcriptional regulator|nr:TetR/AcrR family transcriptional regulator [Gemmatimonadaceae bacterium]